MSGAWVTAAILVNCTEIQFRAQPAAKRELPDCDDAKGYIYVADVVDPRQLPLIEVAP